LKSKHWINLLKLLFAAALIAFVMWRVDWHDAVTRRHGAQAETLVGEFEGSPYDLPVTFRTSNGERVVITADDSEETTYDLRPGAITQVSYMNWWWFLPGALCYFLSATFSAFRWRWLVVQNGLELSNWQAFRLTWIGIFFNNVVPGLTGGDVIKAFYVVRHTGEKTRSVVSVIVDRVMGLMALAILAAVVVLFQLRPFWEAAVGIYGVLLGTCLLAAMFFSKRLRRRLRLDALLNKLPLSGLLKQVDQAFRFYRDHVGGLLIWLVLSIGNHVISVLSAVFIGEALAVPMPWAGYFILIPVINILSSAPITPAGWGVGEALFGYTFKRFGAQFLPGVLNAGNLMATKGVVLSVVYRQHLVAWSLLGGLFIVTSRARLTVTDEEAASLRSTNGSAPQPR
jgi:uncharacterized protein (TIRG00374 family)